MDTSVETEAVMTDRTVVIPNTVAEGIGATGADVRPTILRNPNRLLKVIEKHYYFL